MALWTKYTPQAALHVYVVYQTEKHEHNAGHNGDSDVGRQTPLQLLSSLSSMLVAAAGDGDDYTEMGWMSGAQFAVAVAGVDAPHK